MSAREVFESMQRGWVENPMIIDDLLAEDVVVEMPFAAPGRPKRITGRSEFIAFATAGRAAMPVRIEERRNVVVHETADPDVIVVEYELVGVSTITDQRAAVSFIGVLRAKGGKIAGWREYQDTAGIAAALAS
jgi:ketosteroid isomerase-like protein